MNNLILALLYREIKILYTQKHYAFLKFLFFLAQLTIFYFLCKMISQEYFQFLFYGLVFSKIFANVFTTPIEVVKNEKYWGTIENLFMLPYSEAAVFINICIIKYIFLLGELLLIFLFGQIYGIKFTFITLIYFLIYLVFLIIIYLGVILINFAFSLLFKKFEVSSWLVVTLVDLFSGVYFPVETFPYKLQLISKFLPTTYLLKFLREFVIENNFKFDLLIYPIIFGLMLIPISILFFNLSLRKVYLSGELSSL
mgnify:CR=1 FL=1